jgi:hypothetical protein
MTRRGGAKRVLYRRREVGSTSSVTNREGGGSERYEPVGCWVGREPTPSPSLTLTLILTPIRILIRWAAGWGGSRRLRRSRSSCPSRRACYLVRYFVSQLVASQSVGRSQLVPKSMQVSGPVGNVVVKPATAPTEERMPWD